MPPILLVALGGAAGSAARFALAAAFNPATPPTASDGWRAFPTGTLAVNLIGCALIGLVSGWIAGLPASGAIAYKALLVAGMLGGFTTFSAFGMESVHMMRVGLWPPLVVYVLASTLAGIALAGAGYTLTCPRP